MLCQLPEELLKKVVFLLLPEEGLALARVNKNTATIVQPLQKLLWKQNDGIYVGTKVLYRDFTKKVDRGYWPQWASLVGTVTAIKLDGTYMIIDSSPYPAQICRKACNVRRCRTFYVGPAIKSVQKGKSRTLICPGCYCEHRHGLSLGERTPHCGEWLRHFPCHNYWLCD